MKITRWQRLLCLILAWVLVLQAAPVPVSALTAEPAERPESVVQTPEEPVPEETQPPEIQPLADGVCEATDFTYSPLDEATCEITGYTGTVKEVVIPEQIDGYTVTRLGDSVFHQKAITSVVIPDTVTELGTGVFRHCSSLTQVTIPDGLTVIPAKTLNTARS